MPETDTWARHIVDPVLPEQLPVEFALRGHTSHDDPLARFLPGLEGSYIHSRQPFVEIGFSVHAIADADYLGQWMYIQVCRRHDPSRPFGSWWYGFYYRGGDSPWDTWTLDIIHGETPPRHATFGAYVDTHLHKETR
jgi:hypothetical protein